MPSAFSHDPAITTPGSSTDNAIVIFDGTGGSGFGNSTILVDSGGNGRIGIAGDTDVIIITANTVTVAGTLAATTLTGAGAGITALTAANITASGTLPALNGAALTALTAANITASGTLPALNGAALTALNGTQVTSGTLPAARIGDDSIVEAKLDVSNAPTNGEFLQAQSGEGGGLTWAAAGGSGKILQAQTAIFSGIQTITSEDNSFTDITSLTVNITPAANTSKILILVCIGKHDTNSDANTTQFIVYRGSNRLNTGNGAESTDTTISNRIAASFTGGVSGHSNGNGNQHFSCLDSPATASQITYVVAASCHDQDVYINRWRTDSDNTDGPSARTASSITVLEVGA